jgi:hypothetical protein
MRRAYNEKGIIRSQRTKNSLRHKAQTDFGLFPMHEAAWIEAVTAMELRISMEI